MTEGYSIIYADPPWSYRDRCNSGERGAEFKYPCLTLPELCALQVGRGSVYDLSAARSVCFMWCTAPLQAEAEFLMKAWGFKSQGIKFTWIKTTKNGKLHWGMGTTTRSNSEFVLLGLRGMRLKRQSASVHSVIQAPVGEHSAKPPEVRDRIVELYGDLPRIELFARERVLGWDGWGNELAEAAEAVK